MMSRSKLLIYLASMALSIMLHMFAAIIEMPVKETAPQVVTRETLKISLKKSYTEKPAAKSVSAVKESAEKQENQKPKKLMERPRQKKVVKQNKKSEPKLVKAKKIITVEQEPVDEVFAEEVESSIAPAKKVMLEHVIPEAEPTKLPFDDKAFMDSVLALIELNKSYPYLARRKGQQGVVTLYVLIGANGELLESKLEKSSGHKLLDKNARELVASVFPIENKSGEKIRFVIPVRYRLD